MQSLEDSWPVARVGFANRLLLVAVAVPVAVMVAVFASVTLVPSALGWQSFVVTSASMTPNIPVGAVVVVRGLAAGEVMTPGDVGTFDDPAGQLRVTHRVIAVRQDGNGITVYQTKGDAVLNPDGELRRPEHTVGKVMYTVPFVGWLPVYLNAPGTRLALMGGIVLLLVASFGRRLLGTGASGEASNRIEAWKAESPAGEREGGDMQEHNPSPKPLLPSPVSRVLGLAAMGVAAFALGLAAVALLPLAWDWHPFTMPDASMEPAIPRGALVMTEPMAVFKLQEGEVIAFMPARERGSVYIRRVVSKEGDTPGAAVVRTKGDNVPSPDPFTLEGTQVVGKQVYAVPVVGGWLSWAGSRQGFFVVGALIVALLASRAVTRTRAGRAS